jgi:hypothetical protein
MPVMSKTYRLVATLLWIGVGALSGLTVGVYYSAAPRRLVFLAVLGVGLVLLLRVNFLRNAIKQFERTTSAKKPVADPVTELLSQPDPLRGDAARAWLDQLLVEQQKE